MEEHDEKLELNPGQLRVANIIAALPKDEPPAGLASRTLAKIAQSQPVKRVFWMLRPITNPVARIAAAALIVIAITPITDVETASALGQRIEEKITGARVTEKVEHLVDRLLAYQGTPKYSPAELEPFAPEERRVLRRLKPRQNIRPEA